MPHRIEQGSNALTRQTVLNFVLQVLQSSDLLVEMPEFKYKVKYKVKYLSTFKSVSYK